MSVRSAATIPVTRAVRKKQAGRTHSITEAFESIYRAKTRFSDEAINATCTVRRSKLSGMHVIINRIEADCVFANFVFLTPVNSEKPLAACVQRLTACGSENFPPDFVSRVAREISGAYSGATVYCDRTVYSLNAESDRGLIALLPPALDALFLPSLSQNAFAKHIYTPKNAKGDISGGMYKDLLEFHQTSNNANFEITHSQIYPKTVPYHYYAEGTIQGLLATTIEDIREYHKEYYRPSNCFIILGGNIVENDILTVIESFEGHLPESVLQSCIGRPPVATNPEKSPQLIQPPRPQLDFQVSPENVNSPRLVRNTTNMSGPLPIIRFRSVADDNMPGVAASRLGMGITQLQLTSTHLVSAESLYDLHIIYQGPDFLYHEHWTAFILLARNIKNQYNDVYSRNSGFGGSPTETWHHNGLGLNDCVPEEAEFDKLTDFGSANEKGLESLSLTSFKRKWPLVIFSYRCIPAHLVVATEKQFADIVHRLTLRGDQLCVTDERNLHKLLVSGEEDYQQQLQWRAEYDVVVSLAEWSASTQIGAKGTKECFECCVHPANDFHRLRVMPPKWWESFVHTHFRQPVTVIQQSESNHIQADGLAGGRKSSRWTLSSQRSEASLSVEEKLMERQWEERDEQVEAYLESIGGRNSCEALQWDDDDS